MNLGVFVQFDDAFRCVADLTLPILRNYCARHGYKLHVSENPGIERSIVWDRAQVLSRNMSGYDWIVHVDADVLVTNLHVPMSEFLSTPAAFVITQCIREDGTRHFNDGMLFCRPSILTGQILKDAWNMQSDKILCTQDSLEEISVNKPSVFQIEPQKRFNSFLYPEYGMSPLTPGNWTPGDFALHLPGIGLSRRVQILEETLPKVLS